jgi:hypothetical protein
VTAARKLTAEQRAARRWHRPAKLHLVKLTPVEEIVSVRVQWIVIGLAWCALLIEAVAIWQGWLL